MRYLIDTHIFIWYAKERYRLTPDVLSIIEDWENQIYVSSETMKELVLLWNKKPDIRRWWRSPLDLLRSIEDEFGIMVDYLHKEHYETYARLRIKPGDLVAYVMYVTTLITTIRRIMSSYHMPSLTTSL